MSTEQGSVAPTNPHEIISRGEAIRKLLGMSSNSIVLPSDSLYAQRGNIKDTIQRILNTQSDRRIFLAGAGVTAAGAALLLESPIIAKHILESVDKKGEQLFNLCHVSPEEFFDQHEEKLKRIRLATTFIPEDHDWKDGSQITHHNSKAALEELETIVETLGIKNIRIGIRWENAIGKDGKFDFSFYEPFLKYCFDHKVNLCLNIGLKTCGYPELFIPDYILNQQKDLPDGSTITLDSQIVSPAFEYFHQLLNYLTSNCSEEELALIKTIQPENEAFLFGGFGEKRLGMDQQYVKKLAQLCLAYLPKARIIVTDNLWNLLDRDKAPGLVAEMTQNGDDRWDYGVNYYIAIPEITEFLSGVPFIPKDDKLILGRLDPLILGMTPPLSSIPLFSFDRIRDFARQNNFSIHVSEGQAEPFGGVLLRDGKEPGDSLTGYQYLFYMITEHIANFDQQQIIEVSTWKASQLAKKMRGDDLTQDNRGMVYVTQRLAEQVA